MRVVKQFDDEGCGLACTAMAAATKYRIVRARAFPDGAVVVTSTKRLRAIMGEFGVTLGNRLISLRDKHPRTLAFDALLKVNPRQNGKEWHWVIWDHERQLILDPRRPPYKRYRKVSYVRLFQPEH